MGDGVRRGKLGESSGLFLCASCKIFIVYTASYMARYLAAAICHVCFYYLMEHKMHFTRHCRQQRLLVFCGSNPSGLPILPSPAGSGLCVWLGIQN